MKRFTLSAAAALIAVGLVAGAAAPAMADDAPPVDETATVLEEASPTEEAPPAEEPAAAPLPAEPEAEAPVTPVAPPATQETTPPPAETAPAPAPVNEQWYIGRWALPNGGTPDNVTWPQPVFDSASIPCGTSVWLQIDQYPYTTDEDKARTDAMLADGVLEYGEDHGWVVGWTFEQFTAPACEPVVIPANPTATVEVTCWTADFLLSNATDGDQTASYVSYVDGEFFAAYTVPANGTQMVHFQLNPGVGAHTIELRSGPAQGDALLASATIENDCPVVEPPVEEPPVVEPPAEEPPALTPSVVLADTAARSTGSAETLAQTGGTAENGFVGLASVLLIAGLGLVGLRRVLARR